MSTRYIKILITILVTISLLSCQKSGGDKPPKEENEVVLLRNVTATSGGNSLDGQKDVSVLPGLSIAFSDEIKDYQILVNITLKEKNSGISVSISAVKSANNKEFSVTLTSPLKTNTDYTLSVSQTLTSSSSSNPGKSDSYNFRTFSGIPTINASAIKKDERFYSLLGNTFTAPDVVTVNPETFNSGKPAGTDSWEIGYFDGSGKLYITEPTTTEQMAVFTSGQQGALFYIAQYFLQFYYKTSNIPYWMKCGFGAYQAKIRPSLEKVRNVITTLGRNPSIEEYNNKQFFRDNYGIGITATFFEWYCTFIGLIDMRQGMRVEQDGSLTLRVAGNIYTKETLNWCWSCYLNGCYMNGTNKLIRLKKETDLVEYYYSDFDNSLFPSYSNILEAFLTNLKTKFDIEFSCKISFLLMPERCYHFEWGGATCDVNSWSKGGGLGFSAFRMISPNAIQMGSGEHLMKHEFAHVVQFQIYPNYLPAWLSEGFAEFLSNDGELSSAKILTMKSTINYEMGRAIACYSRKPTYDEMGIYVNTDNVYDYYDLGWIMVDFVVKQFGYSGLKKLVQTGGTDVVSSLGLSGKEEFMTRFYNYYDTNWK